MWPNLGSCFPSHENAKMLQTYADFAGIFDDARLVSRHGINEGFAEAKGAMSSAVLTIARVGTDRADGSRRELPIFRAPRQSRFSRKSHSTI